MEIDLLALRQLYLFLLKTCRSQCHSFQFEDGNSGLEFQLDERAQNLLKHLLDNATARVFQDHSKEPTESANFSRDCGRPKDSVIDEVSLPVIDKLTDERVAGWMESRGKMGNVETERNPITNDLSYGIGLAIRRIESQLLSMHNSNARSNHVLNTDKLALRPLHQASSPSSKPIVMNGIESVFQNQTEVVHGFRIPLSQDNEARKIPTEISKANTIVRKDECGKVEPLLAHSVGSKASIRPGRKLSETGGMIMRPTLLNHSSRRLRMSSSWMRNEKVGSEKGRQRETNKKTHVGPLIEIQNRNQESEYENSNSESESESGFSSSTQESSRVFSSESETNNYPSSFPSRQDEGLMSSGGSSSICKVAPTKILRFRHGNGNESKKATGRLRRIKNKLDLIFHHHHHHHHHHHKVDNARDNFMWKRLRKMFHAHSADKKKMVSKEGRDHRKLKKSAIESVSRKNQVGKFQALTEGLRSHVWKSKAMKKQLRLKGGLVHRKKGVKKLHWWEMFRRHRGVKLPSKGRVKIGYVNRKT